MAPCRYFAILLCFVTGIGTLHAQDSLLYRKVTLPDTTCSVETAIKVIEQKTGLSFSYNSGLFEKRETVSVSGGHEPIIKHLNQIFNDPTLNFGVIGRHLVVYRMVKTQALNPQNSSDSTFFFEIRGKVLGKDDLQQLSFSSVYLVGRTTGIICNEEGEFLLKLSSADIHEVLSISCIGYKNFSAPVSSLINTNRTYLLEADVISIQEVIIRKISPVLLLQSANQKIKDNYPKEPSLLTSFYRETVKRGNRYMMVSEAMLENYKTSYKSGAQDQIKILKARKSEDISSGDTILLKLKAGLNTMLLLDVVKNLPDFLTGESLAEYSYRLADLVVEDGRDCYAIEFAPKEGSLEAIYSGRIIVDIQDMAYKWVEFSVATEQLARATSQFIIKKPPSCIVKVVKANYKVAFRRTGSKYYLHLIQCETGFRIRYRKELSGSNYTTQLEMAVTDIDTIDISRFPMNETARTYDFFVDQVGNYDEAFWGEYNFITPDQSLENALERLSKMQAAAKKE